MRFVRKMKPLAFIVMMATSGSVFASCGTSGLPSATTAFASAITEAFLLSGEAIAKAEGKTGQAISDSVNGATTTINQQITDSTKTLLDVINKIENRKARNEIMNDVAKNFATPEPVKRLVCANVTDAITMQKAMSSGTKNYIKVKSITNEWIKKGANVTDVMKEVAETPDEELSPEIITSPEATAEQKAKVVKLLVDPMPPKPVSEKDELTPAGKFFKANNKIRELRLKTVSDLLTYITALSTRDESGNPSIMETLSEQVGRNSILNTDYQAHLQYLYDKDLDNEIIKQISLGNMIQYYINELKMRQAMSEATLYGQEISEKESRKMRALKKRLMGEVSEE